MAVPSVCNRRERRNDRAADGVHAACARPPRAPSAARTCAEGQAHRVRIDRPSRAGAVSSAAMAECPHVESLKPVHPHTTKGCEDCLKTGRLLGSPSPLPHVRPRGMLR